MFKKIFNAAKDLLRSPVGQLGIGLLLPQFAPAFGAMSKLGGVKGALGGIGSFAAANPMLTQAGLGLLGGDKPANVLRNVAYGTALGGIQNLGEPGGFMGGVQQSLGMTPNIGTGTPMTADSGYLNENADFTNILSTNTSRPVKESLLEKYGLIRSGEGLDFFAKYSPLLKIGAVGASVLSAVLSDEEREMLYDPTKNPYLASGTADKDFFRDINPYYAATMNKGGVMDFPEKDGMINGPGDGQSDDIPAMLSDGEFVMTKQAVMAAGDGDRDKGTDKMYAMMNGLEEKAQSMGIGKF